MGIYLRQWRYKKHAIITAVTVLLLIVTAVATIVLLLPATKALDGNDRWGPNPSWFGNNARYALQNDAAVSGAGSVTIPVYILNSSPSDMVISASEFTRGYSGNALSAAQFQTCGGSTAFWQSNNSFTVPRGCFTYVPELDGWRANVTAVLQNNSGSIQFRLNITSPNSGKELFGYSTRNGATAFAIANQYRCDTGREAACGTYYNFSIPFGTPCSESQSSEVKVGIFDGDNVLGNINNIQYNRYFSVQIFNVTTGQAVGINKEEGGTGNGQQKWYYFTVEPSHKYQFRIYNVYTNNVLQLSLPFDSIESIIDCSYDLYPTVSFEDGTRQKTTTEDVQLPVSALVANNGSGNTPQSPYDIPYTIYRYVTRAGQTKVDTSSTVFNQTQVINSGGVNVTSRYAEVPFSNLDPDGCNWLSSTFPSSGAACEVTNYKGLRQFFSDNTRNYISGVSLNTEGYNPGDTICYFMAIRRFDPSKNYANAQDLTRRVAQPICALVAKSPKVQVLGSDLIVGKGQTANIATSNSLRQAGGTPRLYGSWGEYGIVASGSITNMASGAGYSSGTNLMSICDVSLLTFTNGGGGACSPSVTKGGYSTGASLPDISRALDVQKTSLGSNPSVNLTSLAGGVYTGSGTIRITDGSIARGKTVIINAPEANVTIEGNIQYSTDTLSSPSDIPQVIIIANNINISGSVTQVDAWLVATGSQGNIRTCTDVANATQLRISNCSNLLVINGPVVARHLYLWRTAGSGPGDQADDPAEVINLRPDAYLWATNWSAQSGKIHTTYTKELPPRF